MSAIALALVLLGLALALTMRLSQSALLRSPSPETPGDLPPVSVLKPLKGADENLADNLRTFFRLDYPEYQLLFGVADEDDPALPVVRSVAGEFTEVETKVVVDPRTVGPNPKVNNLANLLEVADHERILISDSNVSAPADYLRDLVPRLDEAGVGIVSSPIRGVGGRGLGGALESYQLNTFVMGSVSAVDRLTRKACVVGKSMLLRRRDLESIGGFPFLGRFLAEDQVAGDEIRKLGMKPVVARLPIDNVLGRLSIRQFVRRHLRWGRIRARVKPWAYAGEILLNPVFLGLLGFAVFLDVTSGASAGAALVLMSVMGWRAERRLSVARPAYHYPVLELLRSVLAGVLWIVPFASSTVSWRGNSFRIGKRTELMPR